MKNVDVILKALKFSRLLLPDHNGQKQLDFLYELVCSTLAKVEKLYSESKPEARTDREILSLVKSLALQLQKLPGTADEILTYQNEAALWNVCEL